MKLGITIMNEVDGPERPPRSPGSGASMARVATEKSTIHPPAAFPQANRSPVLSQFRTNPFRVLRARLDVGVDEAVWKSEEALTRLRAGLGLADGELIPWLAEPDEPEIRQAVQRIEEPLRRLTDQLFWFDTARDPEGELLGQALATLDPDLLNRYLAGGKLDDLPQSATPSNDQNGILVVPTNEAHMAGEASPLCDSGPKEMHADVLAAEMPRLLNHANLRLLLAALSLYDVLPDGVCISDSPRDGEKASGTINWRWWRGLEMCENPHSLELDRGRRYLRARRAVGFWNDALAYWLRLAKATAFHACVQANIARLEDDVVSADDAEVIVNSVTARITDLLVGEVKVQLLAGRIDRVRALLLAAAKSDLEPRRWGLAFKPLRPLFRTEAALLEPLLARDDLCFDDCALYLARLKTLRSRWATLDSKGWLGLDELGDEAVVKACASLGSLESYYAVDRLKALYGAAMGLASADSLKERITAAVSRINGFEHYSCHFCKSREMNLFSSVVIKGKRESHRSYGFNSTTVHYFVKANIIPRCSRCSDLHAYCWNCSSTSRKALGVALAASIGYLAWAKSLGSDHELGGFLVLAAIAALIIWLPGLLIRWTAALLATPRGERRYWRASTAKAYQEMKSEGYKLSVDYRRDAFELFNREQVVSN
jgi:hypothetical protein